MNKLVTAQNEHVNEEAPVRNEHKEKEGKKKKKKEKSLEVDHDKEEFQKARKNNKRINADGEADEIRKILKETNMTGEENVNLPMIDSRDSELGTRRQKKKKHKEEGSASSYINELPEDNNKEGLVQELVCCEERENNERKARKEEKKKEKKKRKMEMESHDVLLKDGVSGRDFGKESEVSDGNSLEQVKALKKKRRKENENHSDHLGAGATEKTSNESKGTGGNEFVGHRGNAHLSMNETGERIGHAISAEDGDKNVKQKKKKGKEKEEKKEKEKVEEKKKKKKKAKPDEQVSEQNGNRRVEKTKKDVEIINEDLTPGSSSKRVSFSDRLEVFTLSDGPNDRENDKGHGLVQGKRFSKEEDELVMEAVFNYIETHGLGDEGVNMVLHCKSHPEIKHCWKEIAASLPWRPMESVYYRAHILFERSEVRKWTTEEYEIIRRFHEKHGSDWRTLADALGKHRFHVKDTWRRIKLPNRKRGRWSQDEYQSLFDLVNLDLRMRVFEEKKSKHGMLRDNISWEAISSKLGTRTTVFCCQKWYDQLTSPMVAGGIWADTDDYRLMDALCRLDACCIEDVDWDALLEHRAGDVCRERWKQMVKHIGEYASKSFPEQVEILAKRYCTDLLEVRETYDNKPLVQ